MKVSDDPHAPMSEVGMQRLGAQIKTVLFPDTDINWTVSFRHFYSL